MPSEPKKRTRGRPRTLDRQRTVEIAVESYWREGPAAVSLNEICRRAEVSKPGVYREFGGEDGLKVAALDHYWERVIRPSFEALSTGWPFREVLSATLAWLTEDRGMPAGCLFARMRASAPHLRPALTDRVSVLREEMRATYESWYSEALARREVNPKIPPSLAGYLLDTQLMAVQMQMALGEPPERVREQAELAFDCLLPA